MTGKEARLIKEMLLMEKKSHEVYSENMKLIFISLPEVPETWDECKTELERLLYIIKNMENLTRESEPYKSGKYYEIFEAAETELLSNEEAVAYEGV